MDKEFYWWSGIIVFVIFLLSIIVIDAKKQMTLLDNCRKERIIGLSDKYFFWEGLVDLSSKGQYQPKCL